MPRVEAGWLSGSGYVHTSWGDWLVEVNVAVPNLDVEATSGVDANPGLVMDGSPLAAVVRERDETSDITTQTFGHRRFFHELLLPTRNEPSIPPSFGREQQKIT